MVGMRMVSLVAVVLGGGVIACGASNQGASSTTPEGSNTGGQGARFDELEASAEELTPERASNLPEVAEGDVLIVVESLVEAPSYDPVRGGLVLEPPPDWTVGSTAEGEEVRLEFLEPEGGAIVVTADGELTAEEVSVTYVVRYSRRNVLLTEAGTSLAVHVVPLAARIEVDESDVRYWVALEATGASTP